MIIIIDGEKSRADKKRSVMKVKRREIIMTMVRVKTYGSLGENDEGRWKSSWRRNHRTRERATRVDTICRDNYLLRLSIMIIICHHYYSYYYLWLLLYYYFLFLIIYESRCIATLVIRMMMNSFRTDLDVVYNDRSWTFLQISETIVLIICFGLLDWQENK